MKKRTVKTLTGLAGVLVALGLVYVIWLGISAIRLRRAYAALEKDGRPVEAGQVIPVQVPETENAALLYKSAALLLAATPAPWNDEPIPEGISRDESINRERLRNLMGYLGHLSHAFLTGSMEPDKRAELEALFARDVVMQSLSTIELGTERPSCRFDRDYQAGLNMPLPFLLHIKDLTNILGAKARLEDQAGRLSNAWDLALTQLQFANALRADPIIVSQVVRISQISLACQTVQHLCAAGLPNEQQYDALELVLRGFDDISPLIVAVDGERLLFGEWVFDQPPDKLKQIVQEYVYEEYAPSVFRWLQSQRVCFRPALLADHAAYVHIMHEHVRHLEGEYARADFGTAERAADEAEQRHPLTGALVPAMRRVKHLYACMTAEVRVTRAGLALLRYQQEHDAWPESLDTLDLEALDDPFVEGPLRYQPETDGFLLYSLGPDQQDDGGRPQEPKQETGYDIVWHFPGPSAR